MKQSGNKTTRARHGRAQPAKPAAKRKAQSATAAAAPLSVVVLAAGQGKRMNSALPKVLQKLSGVPLLRHVLETARELAPAALHVVYGHGGEAVRAAFEGEPLHWALQAEQKGTGHAVQQAMPAIPDDHLVLVLYGDVPLLRAQILRELVALAGPKRLALLTVQLADPAGYGRVLRDARGRVRSIVEHRDASAAQLRVREGNTGVLVAPAGRLRGWLARLRSDNAQGEFYLTDVIAMAVRDGVEVAPLVAAEESEVLGVNDRLQLAQLEAVLRRRRAEAAMRAGAQLADPARFDLRGTLELGRDVFIDVNVVLEGQVRLGDRVRIGPGCVLRDVTLGADTVVQAHSVLEQAETGAHCSIGPFARLRPGARLADQVHVGNYVEIKNSSIATGSKANHLTYLGDATVGAGVNVGAGTICCNYDGVNKSRTVIGDGAFIGSGSMLVAPVTVGEGATVGAGSTITQDAPSGRLTLARSRQVTVEGWQRPAKRPR
ncbi:MAG: bifunctional UDP-N-acetylglucosamine diphosphorylase/glucosamine-1-phosphate N-acetyltransferase GlmU [Steroidobacteraceae bacterium]